MTDRSPSAGYFAFPDFHTAVLWYKLFGRSEPELLFQNNEENETSENPETGESPDARPEQTETKESLPPDDREEHTSSTESESKDSPENRNNQSPSDGPADSFEPKPEPAFELTEPNEQAPLISFFSLEETKEAKIYLRNFPSWYDFVTNARDTSSAWPRRKSQTVEQNENPWSGTKDFPSAIKMALETGWPEGRKELTDLFSFSLPQPKTIPSFSFDVAGAYPMVPLYNAGDPACMILESPDQRSQRPIIRIDIDRCVNWMVSNESIFTRGAAALSLAHTLETLGYSVELRIVATSSTSNHYRGKKTIFKWSAVFKEAGAPLDLDKAAFALAHAAVPRRFDHALLEQHPELYTDWCADYGIPVNEPFETNLNDLNPPIFIPAPNSNSETPETARAAVEEAVEKANFSLESLAA